MKWLISLFLHNRRSQSDIPPYSLILTAIQAGFSWDEVAAIMSGAERTTADTVRAWADCDSQVLPPSAAALERLRYARDTMVRLTVDFRSKEAAHELMYTPANGSDICLADHIALGHFRSIEEQLRRVERDSFHRPKAA